MNIQLVVFLVSIKLAIFIHNVNWIYKVIENHLVHTTVHIVVGIGDDADKLLLFKHIRPSRLCCFISIGKIPFNC